MNRITKVRDYKPLYGFFDYDYPEAGEGIYINGSIIPFEELFDDNPELELNFLQIDLLNLADSSGFRYYLGELQTISEVIEAVRNCFDEYRAGGGSPFFWLHSVLNDIELNYDLYPAIYRGAMQTNLLEWLAFYKNSVTPETTPRQDNAVINNIVEPKPESTVTTITRILEPLRGAFKTDNHIDIIVRGLVEFEKYGTCTITSHRQEEATEGLTEFYEPFVNVWKETGLTPANIGQVLTRFVFMHNGKREGIAPGTVRKNIYECRKELTDRNRP